MLGVGELLYPQTHVLKALLSLFHSFIPRDGLPGDLLQPFLNASGMFTPLFEAGFPVLKFYPDLEVENSNSGGFFFFFLPFGAGFPLLEGFTFPLSHPNRTSPWAQGFADDGIANHLIIPQHAGLKSGLKVSGMALRSPPACLAFVSISTKVNYPSRHSLPNAHTQFVHLNSRVLAGFAFW